MDSVTSKAKIYSTKTALDDFFEQKIEFDISIPDYNPSVHQVLKCEVVPTIMSQSVTDDNALIEVECLCRVIYADEQTGCIRSVCKTEMFSKSLSLKCKLYPNKMRVNIRPVSVNCRVQNPRKLSVKAVIGCAVKIIGNNELDIIDTITDNSIQAIFKKQTANLFSGAGQTITHIEGKLESKSPVNDIISSNANIVITDTKVVNDKIILKGCAEIYCIYLTGEQKGDMQMSKCSIPFSEVVEVEGADENSFCDCNSSVSDLSLSVEDDGTTISVCIDAVVGAAVYNNVEINLLKDVYSMTDELITTQSHKTIESLLLTESFMHNFTGEMGCDLQDARIVALTGAPTVKAIKMNDGQLVIDGELLACVYMYNDEQYKIIEKPLPFTVTHPVLQTEKPLRCEATPVLCDISYSMPTDDTISITASVDIKLCVFAQNEFLVIDSFKPDPEKQHNKCKGLILYNAQKGEQLWDIAKKYHTSVNILQRDNKIDSDMVENNQMLLVSFN